MKTILTALFVSAFIFSYGQTTQTFNYTGSIQTFIVPPCVTTVTIDVKGAQGADNGPASGGHGGHGGQVQGDLPVSPGDTLYIYVGGAGITSIDTPVGGFNGGGGVYSYTICGSAGTGGGASDIRLNDTSLAARIAVGGGGGGAGGYVAGNQTYEGGNGGTLVAYDGVPWPGWPNSAGKGGTQITGGAQGVACCGCPQYTTDGGLGTGGFGSGDCAGGGGGGGGYYGGGGSCFGGGGGGSNYASSTLTNVTHTPGVQTGDGIIAITYTPTASVPAPAGPISGTTSNCEGDSATYSVAAVPGATTYYWTVPAGAIIISGQNTTSIALTYGAAIMGGSITVTPGNNCGDSDSSSLAVTVSPLTTVSLSLNPSTVCINWSPYPLTGGSPPGGIYTGPGVSGGMFNPAAAGTGTWSITYFHPGFPPLTCPNSIQQLITVDLCAGIADIVNPQSLNISPNPSPGLFNVLFPNQEETEVIVLNYMGQEVFRSGIFTSSLLPYPVDLTGQPDGIYILQVKSKDSITTSRLVVSR